MKNKIIMIIKEKKKVYTLQATAIKRRIYVSDFEESVLDKCQILDCHGQ